MSDTTLPPGVLSKTPPPAATEPAAPRPGRKPGAFAAALDQATANTAGGSAPAEGDAAASAPQLPRHKPLAAAWAASGYSAAPLPPRKPYAAALSAAGLNAPPTPEQKPLAAAIAASGLPAAPLPQQKPLAAAYAAAELAASPRPGTKPALPPANTAAPPPADPQSPAMVVTADQKFPALRPRHKPAAPPAAPVENPYRQAAGSASRIARISYQEVMARAAQESNFNAALRSRNSSAAGPFQFIEQTWLDMIRRHGAAYGLGTEARQIAVRNGVARVDDPAVRKHLLDLRHDIHLSAGMAARYLDESGQELAKMIHRRPNDNERRMAYFLGPGGAAKLIGAAARAPHGVAARLLPEAASSNRTLFYSDGQPLSNAAALGRINRFLSRHVDRFAALEEPRPLITDVPPTVATTG
ncbi:MAG: lytic transglycosylase domain-containing protein [Azospirillum sp.]|nr:lytic transglycosylase domain-containing protein [Azospirillum sp.]